MTDLSDQLPEATRRVIFAALVEAEDGGMSVPLARAAIAARFGVTAAQVTRIEREGLDNEWPPL
jgi:hypothetical protein